MNGLWVKIEAEGAAPAMVHVQDTYTLTFTVDIPPGFYPLRTSKQRSVRITVPQEGVRPHDPPPWARDPDEDTQP